MSILRLIRAGAFSGSLIARSGARVSALIKIPIKISGLRDEIRDFIRRRQKKKKKKKEKKKKRIERKSSARRDDPQRSMTSWRPSR